MLALLASNCVLYLANGPLEAMHPTMTYSNHGQRL